MPEEPVPITATRRPVKSTPSWGQWPVWYVAPAKRSTPWISGNLDWDKQPDAMM